MLKGGEIMGGKQVLQDAQFIARRTFNAFHDRLYLLAVSRFVWQGLPATCDSRFLEKTLCLDGRAIFVNDPKYGYLTLRCNISGDYNIYENPVAYHAWSFGYSETFDADKCVRIRNNLLDIATDYILNMYAQRLADIEMTSDVNVFAQRTPILILGSEKQRYQLEQMYKSYDGHAPAIFGVKDMIPENFNCLKTDAPFVVDKLQAHKDIMWNEALTFLGVETNPSSNKKERLIINEVDSNNDLTDLCASSMLLTRQEACEQINKMFNLNVSVKIREIETKEKEVVENE